MSEDDNLTFCKFKCGRNLHTECMERWVKHKVQSSQKVSCPLCRTDWGKNAMEELKECTKQHKEQQRLKRIEEGKKQGRAAVKEKTEQQIGDRSFKCSCCKRQILYESKYQCLFCTKVSICKLCFKGGYHDHHQFVIRTSPDQDWQAAFREGIKAPGMTKEESDLLYQQVLSRLQEKEISTEDYELLLHLENKQNGEEVCFEKFCALAFQKEFKNPESYKHQGWTECCFCKMEILDKGFGVQLKNCHHCLHKTCLEKNLSFEDSD